MGPDTIKDAGLKVTAPRLKILKFLEENPSVHISADQVHHQILEHGDDVSIATIYRVLTQFESAGLVTRHNFEGDHSVYELNGGVHHDHILCVRCGNVEEFIDENIEKRQQEIMREHNFAMTDHHLTIYGICGDCNTAKGKGS